jgi:glycosyltransferase involved in cell wall biosynthesis
MLAAELADPSTDELSSCRVRACATRAIRTLHVINGEFYAGAERVQDLLAGRLPELQVDIGFACLKRGRFAEMRQAKDTPLTELCMRSRFDLRAALRLAALVQREQYDILHTHSARALVMARTASLFCGTPIVHHVHGNTSTEITGRRWTRLNAWAERRLLPSAKAVIAVSPSVAEYLRGIGVRSGRLFVVPNGVPAKPNLPHQPNRPQQCTIGFIALLRPRKGLETLLEAVARLRSQGNDARCRIVGRFETAAYEREIHDRVDQLGLSGAIDWRGFQQQVDAEFDSMDLLAFPSILPEGMPMVLLEAMAAGVPIVASGIAGISDVVADNEHALLVPPGDAPALADCLGRLIGDNALRQRLRLAAYQKQRQRFADTTMAAAIAGIYRTVLEQTRTPA